jgi:vacuolar-type H+-ATPase subunit F/Vma7
MPAPVFIGDEVTAAGYRLAGAHTLIVAGDAVQDAFARALDTAELVFITAASAAALPKERLDAAMRSADPLVLVVCDAAKSAAPEDLGNEVDRALGIQA